jgi:glycosyltransferase involved in cell wall biosynthesis
MSTLRTLVIAEGLPYPAFRGGDLRIWQHVKALEAVSQVGVFGVCSNDHRSAHVPPGITLWRSSTDPALAYPPPQGRKLASRAWSLDPTGHPSDLYYSDAAAAELAEIADEFEPQVVIIEGLWLHRYIELLKSHNCRIILDSHNVETALYQQRAETTCGGDLQARLIREVLPARTATIERYATHAVDQIWVCSGDDARLMKELHQPPVPIYVVPNALNVGSYEVIHDSARSCPDAVDPSKKPLIFLGTFAYWPNAAAAIFLIEEFFPRLASQSPEYQLLLVGSRPTSRMLQAAKTDPRIMVTGAVSDIRPYLAAASVLVVPLFEGGGTRFKILEAFAAKVPVVSTAKGAEGLEVRNERHLLVAENVEEMIDAVRRIWADECLKRRLSANGWELVKQRYSWEVAGRQIRKALQNLRADASS